jgi:hypothetical protein
MVKVILHTLVVKGGVELPPRPIFSLQLQNPSGHTGMLLELVVDMIPLQNDENFFLLFRSWNPIWRLESGFESGK